MSDKVYCKDCKYLRLGYKCAAEIIIEDTWLRKQERYADPSVKNKNNHCKDYKDK